MLPLIPFTAWKILLLINKWTENMRSLVTCYRAFHAQFLSRLHSWKINFAKLHYFANWRYYLSVQIQTSRAFFGWLFSAYASAYWNCVEIRRGRRRLSRKMSVVLLCLKCLAFINCIRYQTLHVNMQCDWFSYGVYYLFLTPILRGIFLVEVRRYFEKLSRFDL